MPFVEILHRRTIDEVQLVAIRNALHHGVASVIGRHDPAHQLTPAMVDLRVIETGPLDQLRTDMLVTVLARNEPAREDHKRSIVAELTEIVTGIVPDADVMIELVLTNRTSIYEYPT